MLDRSRRFPDTVAASQLHSPIDNLPFGPPWRWHRAIGERGMFAGEYSYPISGAYNLVRPGLPDRAPARCYPLVRVGRAANRLGHPWRSHAVDLSPRIHRLYDLRDLPRVGWARRVPGISGYLPPFLVAE